MTVKSFVQRLFFRFLFSILMVIVFVFPAAAAKWVVSSGARIDTLLALTIEGTDHMSIEAAAKSAGLGSFVDPLAGTAAVFDQASRAEFRLGSGYCRCDELTLPLTGSIRRNGARMYLDCRDLSTLLSFVKGDTVLVSMLGDEPILSGGSPASDQPEVATVATPAVEKVTALTADPVTAKPAKKIRVRTVVIDPGHGGKDPGAIGPTGVMEKDIVLSIGIMLRDMLKANEGVTVLMTRDDDIFVPLRERTEFANNKNADLFISIHANSIGGKQEKRNTIDGYKVYFLSQAKSDDDKRVAMLENAVVEMEDRKKGSHLDNILFDMANNEHLAESQDMSIYMADALSSAQTAVARYQKGVGQANFWVLNGAWMPSVLVETCFISNASEEKLLSGKGFQKKMALAMCNAVLKFRKKFGA